MFYINYVNMKRVESYEKLFSEEEKKNIIVDYVENFLSMREVAKKYNIKSKLWLDKLLDGKKRGYSEANKIAHQKHPEKFKHTEESKDKIRQKRLEWMKNNPEKTAWRLKQISYPERCFKKILEDNGIDKKYLIYREYSVFPYFIDFAFVDEKLAVEIDGSQHLEEERKRRDENKDLLLLSKGWRILRITATDVIHDKSKTLNSLLKMLGNRDIEYSKVGILKAPKTKQKVSRGKDGLSVAQRLSAFRQRKVQRPNKEELWSLVKTEPFVKIAEKFGVSDKAIVKWCKYYGLPHRKKDMKESCQN